MHLSPRQYEVMELLAEGWSKGQVGQKLGISVNTVKHHVHDVTEQVARQGDIGSMILVFKTLGWLTVPERNSNV